jgi:hypothetical protein
MSSANGRNKLIDLLSRRLGEELSYQDFCSEYEHTFNFDLEKESVTAGEFKILQALFDRIVWYSPFPDERSRIPNYIGEHEVEQAVALARRELGLKNPSPPVAGR